MKHLHRQGAVWQNTAVTTLAVGPRRVARYDYSGTQTRLMGNPLTPHCPPLA